MATRHNLREKTKPSCHGSVSAISQKSATAPRRVAQNWPSVHCGKSACSTRYRASPVRKDAFARRSGAVGVSRLELVNDARER
jgi:hypothetical protein